MSLVMGYTKMKRVRLNAISKKQKAKNAEWRRITDLVCQEFDYRCQWCDLEDNEQCQNGG